AATSPDNDFKRYNAPYESPAYTPPAPVGAPVRPQPTTPVAAPPPPPAAYTPPAVPPAVKSGSGDRGTDRNMAGNRLPENGVV
ncbi:hypothetical protein LZC33_09825, partial [Campylobacter jejuni]|nr:hypothetical protein [Campylobacter jejuni]